MADDNDDYQVQQKGDEWSLLGAIGIHLTVTLNPNPTPNPDPTPNPNPNPIGSYTVYMWNNRCNVFLWRPVNSTLPTESYYCTLL